jgi:uncharacterized protein
MRFWPGLLVFVLLVPACADPVDRAADELRRRGVAVDTRSLYRSVRQGDLETVELLVAAGVRPNLALRRALEAGRCEALEAILGAGYPRDNGIAGAALLMAQARGQGDCVAALRRAGVTLDGSYRGVLSLCARLVAMKQGAVLRQATLFRLSLDPRDDYGRTPLMEMVRRGAADGVRALLAAGAALDAVDRAGSTALHHALWLGHEDIARLLLASGADPRRRDRDGWDALAIAARTGSRPMVEALLARGASVDATTREGWSALALAEFEGHGGVVEALRAAGAAP